jgi:hypothetical protein
MSAAIWIQGAGLSICLVVRAGRLTEGCGCMGVYIYEECDGLGIYVNSCIQ